MLITSLLTNPLTAISVLVALAITLSIHEAAHAAVANRLGDPTARLAGRLTLNPLAHLDPVGTLLLLIAGFGWGKPVPVNPSHLGQPERDELLVALAGPAANLTLAATFSLAMRWFLDALSPALFMLLTLTIFYNLSLAIFNLIPIPPLDGSRVLRQVLPDHIYRTVEQSALPLLLLLVIAIQLRVPIVSRLLFDSTVNLFNFLTGQSIPL